MSRSCQGTAGANIYALKSLGVKTVISVSAVGSLREEIRPLDMVVPDQLIDRTVGRPRTFFGDGVAAHVGMAEPFCGGLRDALRLSGGRADATVHDGGTLVVIEGPQFSTKAESHMYRSWGADIIGMTTLPEARLAREAELCYAVLACSTDYDCWHESEEPVTVEMVVANLMRNAAVSKAILADVISADIADASCECSSVLENAIVTDRSVIPPEVRERLSLLIGKYID